MIICSPMQTLCHSPAKLILTGEHSVLNACPALSLAINLTTECDILFSKPANNIFFEIELINFSNNASFSFDNLNSLAKNIENRFAQYKNKTLSIQSVLNNPQDLIISCIYHFHQKHHLKKGLWKIKISGHQLLSRGLGSSASVILALLCSLYKQNNIPENKDEILHLAKTIESRQHGNSSGLDPATILFGGLIKYQPPHPVQKLAENNINLWLIDTGIANTSTGQAVDFVKKNFPLEHAIWLKFKNISAKIEQHWLENNICELQKNICSNQLLLEEIGIVPNKVKKFLNSLNKTSSGKICGSGAISGENAGVILCIGKAPYALCEDYGYSISPISIDTKGVVCEVVN